MPVSALTYYCTFGSPMPTRTWSDPNAKYKYGFNGMEKGDDIYGSGNEYTSEWRQLDCRLGRWFSIDPVVFPFQSPYCEMNNNPIRYLDPNGNTIGEGKEKVENLKTIVNSKKQELNESNLDYDSHIKERKEHLLAKGKTQSQIEKDKTIKRYCQSKEYNNKKLAKLDAILNEIKTLEDSKWVYDITTGGSNSKFDGETKYDIKSNHIKIVINNMKDFNSILAHELKHAFQFEEGKLAFYSQGGAFLYDYQDEIETHEREQFLFGTYGKRIIDADFILDERERGYRNSVSEVVMNSPFCSVEEMHLYYYNMGVKGDNKTLIIYNLSEWAETYLRGLNSQR